MTARMIDGCVSLADAHDASRFGGKAAGLARALAAALPVPPGAAVDHQLAARLAADGDAARAALAPLVESLGAPLAIRSSAIGEDGAGASFAGQHATRLGAATAAGAAAALAHVHASAHSPSALAYRARLGVAGAPRMAVIVQRAIAADVAGVLFTRHPASGADERVVEAAWGLGEVVVQGLVTPDVYRVARGGRVLDARAGDKDVRLALDGDGGVREEPVDAATARRRALDDAQLAALDALATACERAWDSPRDLEWCFARGALWLLQSRPITR